MASVSENTMPIQETAKPPYEITLATSDDAEVICDIRDEAWLDTYPNDELGISVEDVRLNAQGQNENSVLKEKF